MEPTTQSKTKEHKCVESRMPTDDRTMICLIVSTGFWPSFDYKPFSSRLPFQLDGSIQLPSILNSLANAQRGTFLTVIFIVTRYSCSCCFMVLHKLKTLDQLSSFAWFLNVEFDINGAWKSIMTKQAHCFVDESILVSGHCNRPIRLASYRHGMDVPACIVSIEIETILSHRLPKRRTSPLDSAN